MRRDPERAQRLLGYAAVSGMLICMSSFLCNIELNYELMGEYTWNFILLHVYQDSIPIFTPDAMLCMSTANV